MRVVEYLPIKEISFRSCQELDGETPPVKNGRHEGRGQFLPKTSYTTRITFEILRKVKGVPVYCL